MNLRASLKLFFFYLLSQGVYLLNEELLYLFHNEIQNVQSKNASTQHNA